MFGFIKECFLTGLPFLSTLTSVNLLSCISMNNQECKVRPQIVNLNRDEPVCFLLVLKQVSAVVVAAISIIHMQNCVFLTLLKIKLLECSIECQELM